jgi:hypothetical protein
LLRRCKRRQVICIYMASYCIKNSVFGALGQDVSFTGITNSF